MSNPDNTQPATVDRLNIQASPPLGYDLAISNKQVADLIKGMTPGAKTRVQKLARKASAVSLNQQTDLQLLDLVIFEYKILCRLNSDSNPIQKWYQTEMLFLNIKRQYADTSGPTDSWISDLRDGYSSWIMTIIALATVIHDNLQVGFP
ncbi:hypothetical protein FPANT_14061 [Fusarium pseudoanthophilum]|uniref:Uncharacterized protein n=1 Tax=Fusarium pseudoanthophilum TaxID=48495 RepID=A0A8H5K763_9HYPO|nr:hypothetical protein FPANT_14061 [Fusarium pseudoanthophilum]